MKFNAIVLAMGILPLVGCGSDGDSSASPTSPVSYSVTAIDGYLTNAQVWLDLNGNYLLDEDEPSALSGADGVAELDITGIDNPEQYSVVVQAIKGQTIDIGDDIENPVENDPIETSYMMSAPAGETNISPISTLVHIILEKNIATKEDSVSLSEEDIEALKVEAIAEVAELLGVEDDQVLGDFIEDENDATAYAAINIVAAQILPETPADLSVIVESVQGDTSDESDFIATAEATTSLIKEQIETVEAANTGEDETSFDEVAPIFTEEDDFTLDSDEDGVADSLDAFPSDAKEWADSDGDTVGNNEDDFPFDATETKDSDLDGVGDEADVFPDDASETMDSDGDGVGDNSDRFVAITNTSSLDYGELRLTLDSPLSAGKMSVDVTYALNSTERASLSLFTDTWESSDDAIADLKMAASYASSDDSVGIKLRGSDDVIAEYNAGESTNISVEWDSLAETYTIAINNLEIGTYAMLNVAELETLRIRLGTDKEDFSTYPLYVDNLTVYSDTEGTTEVFTDNFDGTTLNTDLGEGDGENYSASGYTAIVVDNVVVEMDSDEDGVPDYYDAFPSDDSETLDSDGDGIGDNVEPTSFFPLNLIGKTATNTTVNETCGADYTATVNYSFTESALNVTGYEVDDYPCALEPLEYSVTSKELQSGFDVPFNCASYPICVLEDFNKVVEYEVMEDEEGLDEGSDPGYYRSVYSFDTEIKTLTYTTYFKSVDEATCEECWGQIYPSELITLD